METDKTIAYQRKVEALYANEAVANFRREHFPADPFEDGVLVDASYLTINDLATIYRASKTLDDDGHQPFVNNVVLYIDGVKLPPMVRVNPLFIDACRQRKTKVCELLHEFFYGTDKTFSEKRAQIIEMDDPQLLEYLRQVEEALELTAAEIEVIINAELN